MSVRWVPQTAAAQMMCVLAISLILLLVILTLFEYFEHDTVLDTAEHEMTVLRLRQTLSVVSNMQPSTANKFVNRVSHCHDGYLLSAQPYVGLHQTEQTVRLQSTMSQQLSIAPGSVRVGYATFTHDDFAYGKCAPNEMSFPIKGMVVSVALPSKLWLNAEIHPHEWHVTPALRDWFVRSVIAFLLVGAIAFFFVQRLSRPLENLANSASSFASGLEPSLLSETGPLEVRSTIHVFNVMQRQVVDEMKRRTATLAAISHDLRSPLTALRLKAEMIEDDVLRDAHIGSIDRMERITASALAYLKGEMRDESKRIVDLGELVESECADINDAGGSVTFSHPPKIEFQCRAEALARAVRNLIENAVKYAGAAEVRIIALPNSVNIVVMDSGPGIPEDQVARVLRPFEQLSTSYDEPAGGFGLGLAIANAIVEGHDGKLHLSANRPTGLIVTVRLPLS